ncbi:MAG TPA: hypothetical protein VG095_02495 [Chthoniobacterales bacterium]|nr:hypothetical protein [Chthoniobacterales bacterium]
MSSATPTNASKEEPPQASWRLWLPRVLVESVLVVFSVLLALAVDEWRDDRALQRQVREARTAFAEEIRGNRDLLSSDRYLPHHKRLWEIYRALGAAVDANDSERLAELQAARAKVFDSGVWPAPLRDAVWRSFSQGDLLRHMNPREVFALADAYREQAAVDAWHNRMFTIWSEPRSDKDSPAYVKSEIHTTRSYLADVVAGEERLLKRYAEALALLEAPERKR